MKLQTDWLGIATSGKTIDGRIIPAEHLKEIAEDYNPEVRLANIDWNHSNSGDSFGKVVALRTIKKDSYTILQARLEPNANLIAAVRRGVVSNTSISYVPKSPETGRASLFALAVTNKPASSGTSNLNFNSSELQGEILNSDLAIEDLKNFASELKTLTDSTDKEEIASTKEELKTSIFNFFNNKSKNTMNETQQTEKFAELEAKIIDLNSKLENFEKKIVDKEEVVETTTSNFESKMIEQLEFLSTQITELSKKLAQAESQRPATGFNDGIYS